MKVVASGIEPGQRKLNGPQTTGRTYRNLSLAEYEIAHDIDRRVPMSDGVELMADVHRPKAEGKFPALVAFSAYPRQIQNMGIPMGFVEAGQSDFFVPRGYAHVIANARGTNGSGGNYSMFDARERRDVYDVIEWAARQPWCDGNVGMIGISYFAMAHLEAAVEQPPHLRAIFPIANSTSPRDVTMHGGLLNKDFIFTFFRAVGTFAALSNEFLRGPLAGALTEIMKNPRLHAKWEHRNGESALLLLEKVVKSHHPPHPWDDFIQDILLDHSYPDAFWEERDTVPLLSRVRVPTYLGCDWENLTVHLKSTFVALNALPKDIPVRVALMGAYGLTWPWESLHVEALAWFDQWLRGRDTGIMEGPPVRFILPGAGDTWHEAQSWPPPSARPTSYALRSDGVLATDEGPPGSRAYAYLPEGAGDAQTLEMPLVQHLTWLGDPLEADLDIAGEIVLDLDASISANDTAWFVTLQDVDEGGAPQDVSAGWRRAAVDGDERYQAVTPGKLQRYRIDLIDNARRFKKGHRIGLLLRSDDRAGGPPPLGMHHLSVGTASRNVVNSSSRLTLPLLS
jgi:putative CocE/NonD family hydrolase